MLDWKKRIEQKRNDELRKKQEETSRRKAQEGAKREAILRMEENKLKVERAKHLAKLQARFKCHVCSKPSLEPGKREESTSILIQHHEFYSGTKEYEKITVDDWNIPGDLIKCKNCKKWTCVEHIHWGVCKKCAERL